MKNLNNISSPFCHFVQKVLPLAFDESMSYYECIVAFKHYLENTVIPQINEQTLAITELQENVDDFETNITNQQNNFEGNITALYNQLKDFVDNYFENLDVQEEINNKLDEMVDDGTLNNYIGGYINPYLTNFNSRLDNQDNKINSLASGSPLVASSISEMIVTNKVYVNTSDGKWYYYNGNEWVIGGTYQASEDSQSIDKLNSMISLIKSINLFDKSKCVIGKFAKAQVGEALYETNNNDFAYIIIDLPKNTSVTVSGTSFNCYLINDNNIVTTVKGNPSSELTPYTITNNSASATKLVVNFKFNNYPINTYMIVEGNELPNDYSSYFETYVKLNYSNYYVKITDLDEYLKINDYNKDFTKIYNVGSDKQYTSFTQCIRALKEDTDKKIIYIDAGTYNIFEEIGGSDFALSINDVDNNWKYYNDIIPPNTTIIGLGNVILDFEPTSEEINLNASKILSPINISGNCTLENLTIIADNCRYCIHDETSGDISFTGAIKKYKNVHCIKKHSSNLGYDQAYACGFDDNMEFYFENCIFQSDKLPFSVHNRDTNSLIKSSKIFVTNSAFICGDNGTKSVRLGNINWHDEKINVNMNNCYLNKNLYIYPETNYGKQNYNLTMIGCSNVSIDISLKDGDINNYIPKVLPI